MILIPDIREQNNRPKDRAPKHQSASTIQRQMVQKFVKELRDSAKQPDRSDSAEHTATEQVETTAREIAYEAVQFPRVFSHRTHYTESTEHLQPEQPASPRPTSEKPRQHTETVHARPDTTPQEQGRRAYVQQAAKVTVAQPITPEVPQEFLAPAVPKLENAPRQVPESPRFRADDVRLRHEPNAPQHTSSPAPQELGRRAFAQQAAKGTAKPPVQKTLSEQPVASEEPPTEKSPRLRTEDILTRLDAQKAQSAPAPTAQEQGRRSYMRQAKKSRAEKTSAWDDFHTEKSEIRIAEDLPEYEPPRIREKPTITELRGEVASEPAPEKTPSVRHIKQTGTWTPRAAEPSTMRSVELPIRERAADAPMHDLPPTPQAQARQVFSEKQTQLSQNPSIESIYPSKPSAHISPQLPISDAPTSTPKRQPVTAGSSKSAPPVQPPTPAHAPPAEQPPTIREKPKPNAAPREKSRRGVSIRTKNTEQISAPKAQSKTSVSKIDIEVKRPFSSACRQNKKRPFPSTVENSRIKLGIIMLFNDHVRPIMDYGDNNTSPFVAEAAF